MVKYTRIILYPQAVLDSQFPWGFQARTTNSKFSPLAILKTRSRANSLVATTCDKKNRTINGFRQNAIPQAWPGTLAILPSPRPCRSHCF